MRFEVPQFIEIEDKIFGPFTWRQFIYLLGGIGLAAVLFVTTNWFIFLLFGLPVGLLAVALAFYQVNNRPFSVFLESMVQYFSGHRLYLWRKGGTGVYDARNAEKAEQRPISESLRDVRAFSKQLELKVLEEEPKDDPEELT